MGKNELAKKRILESSKKLFLEKGFEHVTVREIAKKAQCSHTSIYFYFKDKIGVLEEIAKKPLEQLYQNLEFTKKEDILAIEKIKRMSKVYVEFGLKNSDFYELFMTYEDIREDSEQIDWQLNDLRFRMLDLFNQVIREMFAEEDEEYNALNISQCIFYTLHGIVMTYRKSPNSFDKIEERLNEMLVHYFKFMFRRDNSLVGDQ